MIWTRIIAEIRSVPESYEYLYNGSIPSSKEQPPVREIDFTDQQIGEWNEIGDCDAVDCEPKNARQLDFDDVDEINDHSEEVNKLLDEIDDCGFRFVDEDAFDDLWYMPNEKERVTAYDSFVDDMYSGCIPQKRRKRPTERRTVDSYEIVADFEPYLQSDTES